MVGNTLTCLRCSNIKREQVTKGQINIISQHKQHSEHGINVVGKKFKPFGVDSNIKFEQIRD